MDVKYIINSYEKYRSFIKPNENEENKQRFIILFKELDIQLTKNLEDHLERLNYRGYTLSQELNRVNKVISMIDERISYRKTMVGDYKDIIGYMPIKLLSIDYSDTLKELFAYKNNLQEAKIYIDKIKNEQINEKIIQELNRNGALKKFLYEYYLKAPISKETIFIGKILNEMNN